MGGLRERGEIDETRRILTNWVVNGGAALFAMLRRRKKAQARATLDD